MKDYLLTISKDGKTEIFMLYLSFEGAQKQAQAWANKKLEWQITPAGAVAVDDDGLKYHIVATVI